MPGSGLSSTSGRAVAVSRFTADRSWRYPTGLREVAAERRVGFEDLVASPRWVYAVGGGLALAIGIVGAAVAAWRTAAIRPLSELG